MNFLIYLFLPHHSNNHRPKLLHYKSLLNAIVIFSLVQLGFLFIKTASPDILGITADITVESLLVKTNEERQQNGLPQLWLDEELSWAALKKGQDMFARNYWAHNGPDGTTPWVFVKQADYQYTFAGENLAKDFSKSEDIVKAWMASPKHRDNMLSESFEDVGFAVLDGTLNGRRTMLVVQMLGKRQGGSLARRELGVETALVSSKKLSLAGDVTGKPLLDSAQISRNFAIIFATLFIVTLLIDMIVVQRRGLVRLVGHNFDHMLFLSGPLIISIFSRGGSIL